MSSLDRVKFNAVSGGTGSFVPGSPVLGFLTPATSGPGGTPIPNGTLLFYIAQNPSDVTQWEYGYSTSASGGTLFARSPTQSSSGSSTPCGFSNPPIVAFGPLDEGYPVITPTMFGAIGDGSADDTIPIGKFFDAVNGRVGVLLGTYKITSLITKALSSCTILGNGVGGLTGSFGYALLRLLDVSNVTFDGVKFLTTYTNATDDTGTGVVYSYQNNISELSFLNCTFSAPNANTQGLAIYTRINTSDNGHTANGIFIEDNIFTSIGRVGCIIMNRGVFADQYTAMQRVYFNRNLLQDIGLNATFGQALSLDGLGSTFTVNDNVLKNCFTVGLENTVWIDGTISGNRFSDFRGGRAWSPMSLTNAGWSGYLYPSGDPVMSNITISDNLCIDAANQRSNFHGMTNCNFFGNAFRATGDYACSMIDVTNLICQRERYISDNIYALLVGDTATPTQNNVWLDCLADNSASGSNSATVTFDGSNTKFNRFSGTIFKGTGGFTAAQTSGATENAIPNYDSAAQFSVGQYALVAMADADYVAANPFDIIVFEVLRFNGTLTADRNVTFPLAMFSSSKVVLNTTGHNLTFFVAGGGAGGVLANGVTATASYDGSAGIIRIV